MLICDKVHNYLHKVMIRKRLPEMDVAVWRLQYQGVCLMMVIYDRHISHAMLNGLVTR